MNYKFLFLSICFFIASVCNATEVGIALKEEAFQSLQLRIDAHLRCLDPESAAKEAQELLSLYPEDPRSYVYYIKAHSSLGKESEVLNVWDLMDQKFSQEARKREVLEEVCWSILTKARKAGGLTTRLISILGAALTGQAKAICVLKEALEDSNVQLRSIAVTLSSLYADEPLRKEIKRLFYEERAWEVQKEVIKAIAKLNLKEFLPDLMKRLSDARLGAEEKKEIISTIVSLKDTVEKQEVELLLGSKRSVLRKLAAELIAHFERKDHASFLYQLLKDANPDVRISALRAIGILRLPLNKEVLKAASSSLPQLSITANWVLLISSDPMGEQGLRQWLNNLEPDFQQLAAGAILASGRYGAPLAKEMVESHSNPYVKATCAVALIRQRVDCNFACLELDRFLNQSNELWMWCEDFFSYLQKSSVVHSPLVPNLPEAVNQKVRLEILNLLCVLEYRDALNALKSFLKQRPWKVTGITAELLLGEGDEDALELVKELLADPDPQLRVEAALVLASMGHDPIAVPVLLEAYTQGDRSLKLKILESLGKIGDASTTPFLIERLKEPFQILRVVAACILIQTLNH